MSYHDAGKRQHILPFGTRLVVHPDDCHGRYAAELLRERFHCTVHVVHGPAAPDTWALFAAENAPRFKSPFLHVQARGARNRLFTKRGIAIPSWAQSAGGHIALREYGLERLRTDLHERFCSALGQLAMQCGGKQPDYAAKRRRHGHGPADPLFFQGRRGEALSLLPPYMPPQP